MKLYKLLILTKFFIIYPLILIALLDVKVAIAVNIHNNALVPSNLPQRQGELVDKSNIYIEYHDHASNDLIYVLFSFQGHISMLQLT